MPPRKTKKSPARRVQHMLGRKRQPGRKDEARTTHRFPQKYVYIDVHIHVSLYVYVHVLRTYICVYMYMCVYFSVRIYIYMYVCIYIYIVVPSLISNPFSTVFYSVGYVFSMNQSRRSLIFLTITYKHPHYLK